MGACSEEYATLTRQVYRNAAESVLRARDTLPPGAPWVVVLDLDETTLDNSIYQIELDTAGAAFDTTSWNAWVRREQAGAVPGVTDFLEMVRGAGGRVAFISDRSIWVEEATRSNLEALGLWQNGDLICLQRPGERYPKRARRAELRDGAGDCSWQETPVTALAYLGDNMNDFPRTGEESGVFGENFFVLPNPMYGSWERRVTRRR